jgi:GNAT superfamily N-acetyltransferase
VSSGPAVALSDLERQRFGVIAARAPNLTVDSLAAILDYCRDNAVDVLIARCPADDLPAAQAMERAGGQLMDTLVYYQRALDRSMPDARDLELPRTLAAHDIDHVRRIAARAFAGYVGHYHADPRLDRAKCDEVYTSWAERSCRDRNVASTVLIAEEAGRVAGFLTLVERSLSEHEIALNAVDPEFQGRGVYKRLVIGAMKHARDRGADRLWVSTQLINVAAQKTWTRLGFELARSHYTFHLWFTDGSCEPRR